MISRPRQHPPHLLSLEREAIILLLTICTKNRKQILACDEMHSLLRDAWHFHDDYPVGRYVIMPEHIHLFVGENDSSFVSLPDWVAKWKGYVTRRWLRYADRPIWQRSFWTDNFLVQPPMSPNGFMFGGTRYAMAWLIIRMIGRSREKWSVCRGDAFPGRRVYLSVEADMFSRCRRAIELQRGMQRPSGLGVDRAGVGIPLHSQHRMRLIGGLQIVDLVFA
ncbi:MAG: transposase [Chthoniobacterales bacterium]